MCSLLSQQTLTCVRGFESPGTIGNATINHSIPVVGASATSDATLAQQRSAALAFRLKAVLAPVYILRSSETIRSLTSYNL